MAMYANKTSGISKNVYTWRTDYVNIGPQSVNSKVTKIYLLKL